MSHFNFAVNWLLRYEYNVSYIERYLIWENKLFSEIQMKLVHTMKHLCEVIKFLQYNTKS